MKKVLIITSKSEKTVAWKEREQYVKEFCESVNSELTNVEVMYSTYHDLEYSVVDGHQKIVDSFNNHDLQDYALVHFKNWEYDTGEAPVVAGYLRRNNVDFVNSEVDVGNAPGKLAQMFKLSAEHLPVPDTFFAHKWVLKRYFEANDLPASFQYPLIMKANDGSKGDDNYLIHNPKEGIDVIDQSDFEKEYILETYIPNDGDFRFLFVGLDNGAPLIFKRTAVNGSHLNNTSKGGKGDEASVTDFSTDILSIARRSAELLGRQIGGVDVLIDKNTRRPYILEVNGTPAMATGFEVEKKIKRFAMFLHDRLEAKEEE